MKKTCLIMGMPITIEITRTGTWRDIDEVFEYFRHVDRRFSTYKANSEMSRLNAGLPEESWSEEMKTVLAECEQTRQLTKGYFDIRHNNKLDPSGLVKGWAIQNAAQELLKKEITDFYIEAGGDIQVHGHNANHEPWAVGIRNPFNLQEVVKVVRLRDQGIATSGTYIRGQHIYNPHVPDDELASIKSLSVIGPNVDIADRYATAAFAMGTAGIAFLESTPELEGYMIDRHQMATFTSGFKKFEV